MILLLAATTLVMVAATALAAFPGRNGLIVFSWSELVAETKLRYTFEAIQIVPLDGSDPRTVVGCWRQDGRAPFGECSLAAFGDPVFSPDGRWIAFDAGTQIALVRPDGSDMRLLPGHGADDGEPTFSPPGGRLAFESDGALWVGRTDSGAARRILAVGRDPAWSTRGWIAFVRRGQLWRVRPGGRGLRRLTRAGGRAPAWSPDGRKLAFVRRGRLWTMAADGRRARRVARTTAEDVAWSPDGRRFAIHVFDSGVWVVRTDGSRGRQLVVGGAGAEYAFDAGGVDWQPLPRR